MRQVGIEPVTKTKFRIYLDGQFAFVLYKSELSSCHLKDGEAVTEDQIETILSEIVLKRAKRKAMSLLQSMDRTESELRDRLLRQDFPEETVDQAVRYVKSFGYVDDRRLADHIVASRKGQKSRAELQAFLLRKGLSREQAQEALEKSYTQDDAKEAIRRLAEKKHYDPERSTPQEKQKICAYLVRKGFRYEDVRQVIQVSDWNA